MKLAPEHYDQRKGELRFLTKKGARQTLPVTAEIRELIGQCNPDSSQPFIRQLHEGQRGSQYLADDLQRYNMTVGTSFHQLVERAGITRKLTPHDFRRTTAVAMLEETGDIRDVQALLGHRSLVATIWYLDHDLRPVKRSTLEILKNPAWRKERKA